MEFHQLGICQTDCRSTGAIPVAHPDWGSIWLLSYTSGSTEWENESGLLAIGPADRVLWRWKGGDWFTLEPASPASDRTGHLFLRYNPGRYDGLLVLAPTAGGFEDFGTLPSEAELPTSRFYSVVLVDGDGDGIFDIREDINDCDPNCAEGSYESVLHRWNGSDYRPD
ncbi:hypothetical protein [Catenuloplanes japonicus]|uniref:hypothetical protein n=1 Tax=Catenuloplanes japonicus TaxID=33876 RepID=UPI000525D8D9|nr:hypothetical protein [Catenuloplanes japonicus]